MPTFEVSLSVYEGGRRKPEYTLDSDLRGEITLIDLLEYTKQALIVTADEVLKDAQSDGFDKKPVVVVDNRANKPIQSVSPLGQIEFIARANIKDVLLEAYNALLYRSKVLTGLYKSSHFVFLNGYQVATDLASLETWVNNYTGFKDSDLIRIVNIQPYARKLERYGITAQRGKTSYQKPKNSNSSRLVLVPNGTYALTARALRTKYKRNSLIKFQFLSGGSLGISGSFKGGRSGRGSSGRPYLYPSIVISVQERGTV